MAATGSEAVTLSQLKMALGSSSLPLTDVNVKFNTSTTRDQKIYYTNAQGEYVSTAKSAGVNQTVKAVTGSLIRTEGYTRSIDLTANGTELQILYLVGDDYIYLVS